MKLLSFLNPSVTEFIYTNILKPKPLRAAAHFIIKRMIPPTLKIEGVEIAMNQGDPVVCGALTLGCYERFEIDVFRSLVKPGATVLDIGANVGLFSAIAASLAGGEGRVISVEPEPKNCGFLRRTASLNGFENITVVQAAVSSENGSGELFLSPENMGDHRLFGKQMGRTAIPIRLVTIDTLLEECGVRSADVIKIDIQGAEALAFDGMVKTIKASACLNIIIEFWPWGIARTGKDPAEFLAKIRELGFDVYEINGDKAEFVKVASDEHLLKRKHDRDYANLLLKREPAKELAGMAISSSSSKENLIK